LTSENTQVALDGGEPSNGFIERAERFFAALSSRIAALGVIGMLFAAVATTVDVLMRWAGIGGVVALNELVLMAFVVAITATISSGFAQRVGVVVDLLAGSFGARWGAWLTALGSLLLLVLYVVIGLSIFEYANILARQNRTTAILGIPQAPVFFTAAALLGLSVVTQAVVTLNDLKKAILQTRAQDAKRLTGPGLVILLLVGATAVLFAVMFRDFGAASRWAQSNITLTVAIGFVAIWVMLAAMIPVAVITGLVGIVGIALFIGPSPAFNIVGSEVSGFLTNYGVATLPLFLMMGSFAVVAGISDDIYRVAQALLGSMRGGLAMSTIGSCAGFGAVTGSSLTTVAMFGRIALPQMKERKYAPEFAASCVAAGGTLGAIIPPSSVLVIYSLITEASLGQLFMAAIIPATLATLLYIATVWIMVRLVPSYAPPPEKMPKGELRLALVNSVAFISLFGVVIGGLYTGILTATESASVGAVGAFLIALFRRKMNSGNIWHVVTETTRTTSMIYTLIFSTLMFSFFMVVTNLPEAFADIITALPLSNMATLILILVVLILLGCVMDSMSIMLITVPILLPLVQHMGYEVIWWGIISLLVVENGLITPPFGLHLFMLRSMDRDISLKKLYVGIVPFIMSDIVRLALLVAIPALVLWLPSTMSN
jgi:C4-dicarboxylate transporter DctM subunit